MFASVFWLLFTIIVYGAAKKIYRKYPKIYLTPLLITPIIVIASIKSCGVSFATYNSGSHLLTDMVEPATIALAVTLYKHLDILRKYALVISVSVTCGALAAFITSAGFTELLGLNSELVESLAPRSATTPIALSISHMIGGLPTITAVSTLVTGITGMIIGPLVIKWCRFRSPVARGVLFGTSAHSAGISKAFEYSQATGSVAGIAMMLTAFVTLCAAPLLISLFT
ncbi:LrgB family protein [Paenibacillus protaetiae]|uniref:LrgB family protein n=1 Tax=Paenibacillus protaetiae TaxID=2509456 RepID=A0A4P6EVU3_9BACL|nr:LrgB family protein [Paenibacillus protaetiae]QAY66685.1 LrgB family protein [Paenibacillus protaetiae]